MKEWIEYTLGEKSELNLAGKVVFAPIVVVVGVFFLTLDFLFVKRNS